MPFWKEPSSPTRQDRRRGYFLGKYQSRAPSPAKPLYHSFYSPNGGDKSPEGDSLYACRRGVPFTRVKGTKTRLGLCPKTPVAGCAGYGLICGESRKSIRTAHRIAPKVACGSICPYRLASSATGGARLRIPPPPFPRRKRGSDGRASAGRQFGARGMLGPAKTSSR